MCSASLCSSESLPSGDEPAQSSWFASAPGSGRLSPSPPRRINALRDCAWPTEHQLDRVSPLNSSKPRPLHAHRHMRCTGSSLRSTRRDLQPARHTDCSEPPSCSRSGVLLTRPSVARHPARAHLGGVVWLRSCRARSRGRHSRSAYRQRAARARPRWAQIRVRSSPALISRARSLALY